MKNGNIGNDCNTYIAMPDKRETTVDEMDRTK